MVFSKNTIFIEGPPLYRSHALQWKSHPKLLSCFPSRWNPDSSSYFVHLCFLCRTIPSAHCL